MANPRFSTQRLPTDPIGIPAWLSLLLSTTGATIGGLTFLLITLLVKQSGTKTWLAQAVIDPINFASFIAFGIAIAQLTAHRVRLYWEEHAFQIELLGIDEETLILPDDALDYRKKLKSLSVSEQSLILVRLLSSALQSARSHWSSVSAAEAVKIRAEILQSQSDAQLATVRYLAWAIPSIGFIGTVIGIGQAMGSLNIDPSKQTESINQSVGHLHTAFGTTFVALLLSLILMYIVHRVQADDDTFLAKATDWCMRWFVFRMYVPRGED